MNALIWLVQPRSLALIALVAASAALAWRHREAPIRAYTDARFPPQGAASPLGKELTENVDRRLGLKLERARRRLAARLEAARRQGFDVAALESELAALPRAGASGRHTLERIAALTLAVPRKHEAVVAVVDPSEEEPIEADVAGKAVRRQSVGRKR